jgi:hypothetical protein
MKPVLSVCSIAFLLVISLSGCRDTAATTNDLVTLNTETLNAPPTIAAGATLTVALSVDVGNCLGFDHIQATRTTSQVDLVVWGSDARVGNPGIGITCTAPAVETHEFQLAPPFQSPFTVTVDRGRLPPLTAIVQVQ